MDTQIIEKCEIIKCDILRQYFFLAYSHNLIRVHMECDYTHLNHNSLMSQQKWSPKVWL
jgi:hypothetical protein